MRNSLIAVRRAAATVLFVLGVGALAGLAAPAANAAPVQAGFSQSPVSVSQLPEWGPCDFNRCNNGPGSWQGGGNGCWNGCGGPAMVWHSGPAGAPPVLVESWKIDWQWCWRGGDQGLNWYLDPPRW